jgi:transcriptional regulator with XRE-family HTH domain
VLCVPGHPFRSVQLWRSHLFLRSLALKRIAQERYRRGHTQRQVAERLKIGLSTYFKIEQGALVPGKTSGTTTKLQRYFGRRLKTLLSDVV